MRIIKWLSVLAIVCAMCTVSFIGLAEDEVVNTFVEDYVDEATAIEAEGLYAYGQEFFSEEASSVEPEGYIVDIPTDDFVLPESGAMHGESSTSAVMALAEKEEMPISGQSFEEAISISPGLCYFIEISDLEGSSFFGYKGWYKFKVSEKGLYHFTGKNITSSWMGIEVFNRYNEWICGTAGSDFYGLYSGGFDGQMTYGAILDEGETYYIYILNNGGKCDLTICTPSIHPVNGSWEITIPPTCQPGKKALKCAACGTTISVEELSPTDHVAGEWTVKKEATNYEEGEMIRICTVCGKVLDTKVIPREGIQPTGIRLSIRRLTLRKGETYKLEWTVEPENAVWSISTDVQDESIVELVDEDAPNGYTLHAKKVGTTIVACTTHNDCSASCTITVIPKNSIRVNASYFPDAKFRSYVSKNIDKDHNGWLSADERNAVKEIDVQNSGITQLTGISRFPNLSILQCQNNRITKLDLSRNTKLSGVDCSFNKLSELYLGNNSKLSKLYCYDNKLTSLYLKQVPNLKLLWCDSNKIKTLDLSKNTKLKCLSVYNTSLQSLNIKGCQGLKDCLNLNATIGPNRITWRINNNQFIMIGKSTKVVSGKTVLYQSGNPKTAAFKNKRITMKVGDSRILKPILTPTGVISALTWSTSNNKVATVNKSGKVVAVAKGTATITVKTGNNKSAKIIIIVK